LEPVSACISHVRTILEKNSKNILPVFSAEFSTIRQNLERKDIIEIAINPMIDIIQPSDTQTQNTKERTMTGTQLTQIAISIGLGSNVVRVESDCVVIRTNAGKNYCYTVRAVHSCR
jgi:hypothetical protein